MESAIEKPCSYNHVPTRTPMPAQLSQQRLDARRADIPAYTRYRDGIPHQGSLETDPDSAKGPRYFSSRLLSREFDPSLRIAATRSPRRLRALERTFSGALPLHGIETGENPAEPPGLLPTDGALFRWLAQPQPGRGTIASGTEGGLEEGCALWIPLSEKARGPRGLSGRGKPDVPGSQGRRGGAEYGEEAAEEGESAADVVGRITRALNAAVAGEDDADRFGWPSSWCLRWALRLG